MEDSFDLNVRADYLTLGLRENGRNSTARILNFHLARNPEIAFLWNMADNYSNLLNPELSISCPFILTLTLVVEDRVKTHSEANLKYMDRRKVEDLLCQMVSVRGERGEGVGNCVSVWAPVSLLSCPTSSTSQHSARTTMKRRWKWSRTS